MFHINLFYLARRRHAFFLFLVGPVHQHSCRALEILFFLCIHPSSSIHSMEALFSPYYFLYEPTFSPSFLTFKICYQNNLPALKSPEQSPPLQQHPSFNLYWLHDGPCVASASQAYLPFMFSCALVPMMPYVTANWSLCAAHCSCCNFLPLQVPFNFLFLLFLLLPPLSIFSMTQFSFFGLKSFIKAIVDPHIHKWTLSPIWPLTPFFVFFILSRLISSWV